MHIGVTGENFSGAEPSRIETAMSLSKRTPTHFLLPLDKFNIEP